MHLCKIQPLIIVDAVLVGQSHHDRMEGFVKRQTGVQELVEDNSVGSEGKTAFLRHQNIRHLDGQLGCEAEL